MAIFPFSVDSVRIGTANITASGGNIVLPAGTQVGNQPVATVVEVSTGGGPKITNLQITDNAWTVLDDTAVDTAGGYVLITGTNFVSGALVYFNQTPANSVAFVGTTTLRVTVPALTAGTYIVYVINPDGGTAIRVPGLTASANPAWQTGSALPEQYDGVAITLNLVATDATSYTVTSGSLPPGLSLNANTGVITGTVTGVAVDTVYTFTVRATDAQLQDSPRTFTITITVSDPYFKLTTLLLSGSAISANTVIRDSSTNNFNLTVFGDARASNFTPYGTGWSVYFDGTNDYLTSSSNADFNLGTTFSIEGWIYSLAATKQVIANLSGFVFIIESTGLLNFYNGSTLSGGSGSAVSRNTWVHVAFTRDASNVVRGFVNGVLTWAITVSTASSQTAVFIGSEGGTQSFVNGYLSNIRIVKGAIPSSYQTSSTTAGTTIFTPPTSNLTAISGTSLLTCQSNRFVDNSTVPKLITPTNGPLTVAFNPFNITNTGTDGSMYFDGTGDYCTTSGNAAFALGTGDFCLETWIYPNSISTGTFDRIVATSDYNGTGFDWTLNTASSALYVAGTAYSISNLVVKSWNHLVYTRSSGVLRGFLNGNLAVYNASATGNVTSTGELRIGTGYSGTAYNGYISNLRIVKGSVPAAYQTSSTTVNTSIFSLPTTLLTAVTGTSLLTLQYDQPHNNHTFLDSSSNQFVVNRAGNASQGTFSPFSPNGWSNLFNGSSTLQTTALNISTGSFTIEAWVYLNAMPTSDSWPGSYANWMNIVCVGGANLGDGWQFRIGQTILGFGTNNDTTALTATHSMVVGQWYHLACVRDGNLYTLYRNGVSIGSTTYTANSPGTGAFTWIGSETNQGAYLNGYISNLRIIAGTAIYTTSFTPSTTPFSAVSGTVLLTCQNNRFRDNSTNNFVFTINGSPSAQAFSPFAPIAVHSPVVHGGSVYYDASGDSVTVPSNSLFSFPGDFCIEAWVYPSAAHTIAMKYVGGDVGNSEWYFAIDGTFQLSIALDGGGSEDYFRTATNTITPNAWNHCVATRSGTAVRLFINGVLRSYNTTSKTLNTTGTQVFMNGNSSYQAGFMITRGAIPALYQTSNTTSGTAIFTPPSTLPVATANTSILLNYIDAAIPDSTGRSVVETVADAKSTSVVTKFTGGSMYFDSAGDYLTVPYSIALQFPGDFTVECWVNLISKVTSNPCIVNNYSTYTTNGGFAIFASHGSGTAGKYNVSFNGSFPVINSTTSISYGSWQHIALVRSGTTLALYVDGVANGTSTQSATVTGTANYWWIGTAGDTIATSYLNGYINDLRVTKGHARYTTAFTPPTVPARLK